jgi:hypothetical protein
MIVKKPDLKIFTAILSQWGEGFEVQKAVDNVEELYKSGYAKP